MTLEAYRVAAEPFYQPLGDEIEIYLAAFSERLPVMLKGPTGCGKTRFVEHMAWRLGKPLITVAAHEDMTASDLAGRYLLEPEGTVWHDGPLTLAVRHGAICYLDEIVEARQDTTVVINPSPTRAGSCRWKSTTRSCRRMPTSSSPSRTIPATRAR